MALADYVAIPVKGLAQGTIRKHKDNIVDVRVVKSFDENAWFIKMVSLPGETFYLDLPGSPHSTKEDAILAMEAWLESF